MKNVVYMAVILVMLAASMASAQARFDSVSLDPPHVEPGMDVNIYAKFHEGLTKREIYTTPKSNGEKMPLGEKSDTYYTARIIPKDEATRQYILIKEGERDIGHMFAGETWTAPFEVHISDNAPPTNYTLTFELFKTSSDSAVQGDVVLSKDISILVDGVPKFTLDSDSQLRTGETKQFALSLGNVGGGVARHVTVSMNATSPLTVLKSSSVYVGDMTGKSSNKIVYELYVDSAASPKAYTIPVEIKYTDRDGVTQTVGKTVGVKVQGSPQVMVSLDSSEDLKGGLTGKVTLSAANKGFIEAKFLSLSVSDTEQYTVTSKNNVYIGNLASDDFQSEDFEIRVKDGVQGKIPLKVAVTYTEENNNQVHSEDAQITVNVMSKEEYESAHPSGNGTQQYVGILLAVPVLIVGYLAVWLLLKIVGSLTSFIDRKMFRKQ
jgi:hypothetical protein